MPALVSNGVSFGNGTQTDAARKVFAGSLTGSANSVQGASYDTCYLAAPVGGRVLPALNSLWIEKDYWVSWGGATTGFCYVVLGQYNQSAANTPFVVQCYRGASKGPHLYRYYMLS